MERRPSKKGQSWGEILQGDLGRLQRAFTQVSELTDIDKGNLLGVHVTKDPDGGRSVALDVNRAELRTAPRAIRRMLRDLGIEREEYINVQVDIPPIVDYFQFTVQPLEVTEEKFGLILSTKPGEGAVIAPVYTIRAVAGVEIKPNHFGSDLYDFESVGFTRDRARNVFRVYRTMARNIVGNVFNKFSSGNNPYMIEIMTSAASWVTSLVATRRAANAQM